MPTNLKDRARWAITFVVKNKGLSNKKVAEKIGIGEETVGAYRNKATDPKVDFIVKFCKEYKIDTLWFITGEGEPFPGARLQHPEVCDVVDSHGQSGLPGPPRRLRIRPENNKFADPQALYGKIRRHEVDGEEIDVTEFDPEGADDPFAAAVSGLKQIFDSGDDRVCEAILANIGAFSFASQLLNKYRSLEKQVSKNTDIIEHLKDVIEEHKPPKGEEERRKAWIAMKKAIGLD